ncbi:MAG: hypothetical protein DWG76_03630 [Chloroflexi bacterium]|nr:FtsQ-type POTRA domain-containing protein [Chloroflexota bacterium]MQC26525.1 hypothetical protein [Chloroflexota bacterium]
MANGDTVVRRSQSVRARRMARRAGKVAQKRGSNRRDVPQMVARNPQMERRINMGRQAARKPKYLNLATDGAELRLPVLPAIRLGWRAVSALTVAFLAVILFPMLTGPAFNVGRVELRDATRLNAQDINSVLGIAGSSIFSIEPGIVAARLADAFPELEGFSVHVGFPARVVLFVEERQPILAWQQSDITVWVDDAGVAFIPEGEPGALIEVLAIDPPPSLDGQGYARHQLIRPQAVQTVLTLSQHAPQSAVILYDAKLGFGWTDPAGWDAFFGIESVAIDQRMAIYDALVDELQGLGLVPTLISVGQLHAPYYRLDY